MSKLRKAAAAALEAYSLRDYDFGKYMEALRAALVQQDEPVQEPVAWSFEARHIDTAWGSAVSLKHPGREHKYMRNVKPLYLASPQRKPLTEEEMDRIYVRSATPAAFGRGVERAHGIGGDDEQV